MSLSQFIVITLIVVVIIYLRDRSENEKFKKEVERIQGLDIERKKIELMKLQSNLDKYKTNHILHLLLSLFTISIWIIPWFLISRSNASKREKINQFISAI